MVAWGFDYGIGGNKNGTREFRERLNAAGIPVCLKGVADAGLIYDAQNFADNVLIYRATDNDVYHYDTPLYHLPPAEAAQQHYEATAAVWPPELDRSIVWMECLNEPRQHDSPSETTPTYQGMLTASWLGYFMIEYAELASVDGFKVCGPTFNSGEPEIEYYSSDGMKAWLAYCAEHPHRTATSGHEYNFGSVPYNANYPWHYGRFQAAIAAADKAGIPRDFNIFITEYGWQKETVPKWENALPTLNAYNTLCADFPQVKGIAIWTLREPQPGWGDITNMLAEWISQ